ncbi:AraC family transcriptional regulator [Paenibacillus filicis]|uniref:AraC family transcriptional regulator n=1 Tax=Paenibacillus gyeongsangnamensis TaxID=3388067 RepID=A0ABT4Q5Q9_9BACL|nr:Ada metal-binding domain-containing protein [Paenibacillus filicis]MCZ8512208.1 AraC family transcriptional regulator [Paenibacillus filicis]
MDDTLLQSVYDTILTRDTRYDGQYYVGIVTTGIFCRPSCRSRLPKPENVRVYGSIAEAQEAGFRPCKRCRPEAPGKNGPDAELVQAVTGLIAARYSEPLTLNTIAAELKMSPYHLQRLFKRTTGTTPSKRLVLTRLEEAKRQLAGEELAIADIAAAVGFRSASHFSSVFQKSVGCTPNEYRLHSRQEVT